MTGPEHYREAGCIITGERCDYGCPHSGCQHEMAYLARAQVHATLALAAATALGSPGGQPCGDGDDWNYVASAGLIGTIDQGDREVTP